jgi:hypothetical protein
MADFARRQRVDAGGLSPPMRGTFELSIMSTARGDHGDQFMMIETLLN